MAAGPARYHEIVVANGYPLPADYARYAERAARMSAVLAAERGGTAPCHNDLMPGNLLESHGPGSRCGSSTTSTRATTTRPTTWATRSTSSSSTPAGGAARDRVPRVRSPRELARARLWSLMSQWGWSLWGSIRIGATGDPEIIDWAAGMWARAVAQFESPDFEELLARAQARGR